MAPGSAFLTSCQVTPLLPPWGPQVGEPLGHTITAGQRGKLCLLLGAGSCGTPLSPQLTTRPCLKVCHSPKTWSVPFCREVSRGQVFGTRAAAKRKCLSNPRWSDGLSARSYPAWVTGVGGRPTCLQSSAPQNGGAQSLVVTGGVRCIRWQAVQGGSAGSRPRAQGPSWSRMQIVLTKFLFFFSNMEYHIFYSIF